MSNEVYRFFESSSIPSIAREDGGEGHNGLIALVDIEKLKVIATNFDNKKEDEEIIVPLDSILKK